MASVSSEEAKGGIGLLTGIVDVGFPFRSSENVIPRYELSWTCFEDFYTKQVAFLVLNFISQSSAQICWLLWSCKCWRLSGSCVELIGLYSRQSFANNRIWELTRSGKSLMWQR